MILSTHRWRGRFVLIASFCVLMSRTLHAADQSASDVDPVDPVPVETVGQQAADADAPRIAASDGGAREHPLLPAIAIAQASLTRLQNIRDYEATLIRRQRVDGELREQTMHLKRREQPLSIYLKFGEPFPGHEVLFVDGQNGGELWTHEGSNVPDLVGAVSFTTGSPQGTPKQHSPVTQIDLEPLLESIIRQWKLESQYGECDVRYFPNAKLRGRSLEVIESSHPRPRRQFPFQRTRVFIDAETRLPIRFEQYGFAQAAEAESPLLELHDFIHLKTNVGLTDHEFDHDNPNYSF